MTHKNEDKFCYQQKRRITCKGFKSPLRILKFRARTICARCESVGPHENKLNHQIRKNDKFLFERTLQALFNIPWSFIWNNRWTRFQFQDFKYEFPFHIIASSHHFGERAFSFKLCIKHASCVTHSNGMAWPQTLKFYDQDACGNFLACNFFSYKYWCEEFFVYSPALLAFTLNVYRRFLLCLFCVLLMYILKSPNGLLLEMSFFFRVW